MKSVGKFLKGAAAVTAFAIAAALPCSVFSGNDIFAVRASAAEVLSVDAITKNMGVGWNLGNSLDAHNSGKSYSDILEYEKQWGNPVVTKELIDTVKAKGFNTVRIPITWYQHIANDGNYTIDPAWMNRVKEVVDYAYDNGMYVIINIHHEEWIDRSDFANAGDAMETELRAVWKQIAAAFADYGQRLIFEGMNEPRADNTTNEYEWNGDINCYNVVNRLNKAFVETVRSVESDYRQTRMLMIPDYAASRESSIYSYLTVPKAEGSIDADNDGDDDFVAVSIHAYSPFQFAMSDGDHSDFNSAYEAELDSLFSGIQSFFLQEGVPVVLGEFSASNYGYDDARVKWAKAYMSLATEYGIPCVLWDNNMDTNPKDPNEAHGYINRSTLTWYNSGEKVVDTLISTRRSTSWGTKKKITYPMYTHNDYSTGSYVNIADDGAVKLYELNGFASGKEFAIKFSGSTTPALALANISWGGWTTFNPYDFDKKNGIAYVSYDQMMKVWNPSNGELAHFKVHNKNDIGFEGIVMLDVPEQKPVVTLNDIAVTDNEVLVYYSDGNVEKYAFEDVTNELILEMADRSISLIIDYVNAFSKADSDIILTQAQLKAIEMVLDNDY